LFYWVSWN